MAQVVLGGIGAVVGGGVGQAIGAALGGMVDRSLVASLSPARQRGPRLESLKIQSSADGAPMACVFGRARVTGQVIWAARFQERRTTSSGGKGGPKIVDYDYSLSFAVALCEGPIDGVGRVWADGQPMDLTGVTMRVYRGTEEQTPDPLIEVVEGTAPAYRGTAYVVFEDLALTPYGDRPPQLAFEVFRRARGSEPRLEDRLEGVCLIPGAGEFVLATEAVLRREGLTRTAAENVSNGQGHPDLLVSLDQLLVQCPNLKRVSLVIGWFGDDLRAGVCTIRPGVERRDKPTAPMDWSVAGLDRGGAHLISQAGGGPAYGGTPSDETVRQAVAALQARGLAVTLYPFVFMDIPADNGLPDPYGGARQAAYPWRGRIRGTDGAGAAAEVESLFGAANGWGLRRLALHYAGLAAQTGADGLLIGSEMRALTWTRDADGGHPAVAQLRALAAECRAVVGPEVALSYAADWSEYFGHHDGDHVIFHLDPLWADANIDFVGIDWYPPLGDWRGGDGGVDAVNHSGPDEPAYLAGQIAGGEGFDWFYADAADRAVQLRTPIQDLAHGEDWVFRPKDLSGWWSNLHHDRPGGVRAVSPTAWVPGMKPVRLTEFGCAAVDRGGNAPNLFQDPKSTESGLPPSSTGVRDDRMQRRALEAVLGHFGDPARNPVSPVYGGAMLGGADAWCWDARPWPEFPARLERWADAAAWRAGHWLNGRMGGDTTDLLAAILERGGVIADGYTIGPVTGTAAGYVIDRPMRTRDALEPLLTALDLIVAERDGRIAIQGAPEAILTLGPTELALGDEGAGWTESRDLEPRPSVVRVRFIDADGDYQTGSVTVRSDGDGGGVDLDLPAVCGTGLARATAGRLIDGDEVETLILRPGPLAALRLEPGDGVSLAGVPGLWRVARVSQDENPTVEVRRYHSPAAAAEDAAVRTGDAAVVIGAPLLRMLDLPALPGREADGRPVAVVAAEPWWPMAVHVGPTAEALTPRVVIDRPATVGSLVADLMPGVRHRWDAVNSLTVRVEGGALQSRTGAAVLGVGNLVAVESAGGWELIQFRSATLIGGEAWRLEGLLRGQQGTEREMAAGAGIGSLVVFLDDSPGRADIGPGERGLALHCRAGPVGMPPGGAGFSATDFTFEGLIDRPWSPAHLRVGADGAGGLRIDWIPRVRLYGDRWDREPVPVDAARFRLRVLEAGVERRVIETEAAEAVYPAAALMEDFPGGPGAGAVMAVCQWNPAFGWGTEAMVSIPAA
ncbi:glycoside hydrolase/phage tail family protein [uncultured Brevundimonas sp.]|uniref:baseplate multidomain protein megatron n=1 Tax=uncultured Brevundimonas sp. TaxID=213418 RepID=UPI0030EC8D2D|tara:strand:- start:51292 stop:55023 length:3732 start_codon:yes stop_codon:yes gene_type:complete